jgi:hypothetical protein
VWRSAKSPDTAVGLVFRQARAAYVDYGVTRLSFGAVKCSLDCPVARPRIEALELDRYIIDARVGRASVDPVAFGY